MSSQSQRLELIRNASNTLARVALRQDETAGAMDAMCKALNSDSAALLSLDVAPNGQVRAIVQHSRHLVRDRIHSSYINDFFKGDPVLSGAVKRLRAFGWTVFRLGDPDAKVKSEAHERYLEEFLYPSGIKHIMALASLDPVVPNRINLVGCHRNSGRSGFTFADLENAQVLAPATQACFLGQLKRDSGGSRQSSADLSHVDHVMPDMSSNRPFDQEHLRPYDLTDRELDIVDRVLTGAKNSEISDFLGISVKTVENHLSSVFSKTHARSRQELILLAVHPGSSTSIE